MATTGPATPHRHRTKSGVWYDLADEPKHTHPVADVDLSGYATRDSLLKYASNEQLASLATAVTALTERVRTLEAAAPAPAPEPTPTPTPTNDQGAIPYGG